MALVEPGASTLIRRAAQASKKRCWQWGDLTITRSKFFGFWPCAKKSERSYKLTGRLVAIIVMLPASSTAVGPLFQMELWDSLINSPSANKRTLALISAGVKRSGSNVPPIGVWMLLPMPAAKAFCTAGAVSYTHLTLPTKA